MEDKIYDIITDLLRGDIDKNVAIDLIVKLTENKVKQELQPIVLRLKAAEKVIEHFKSLGIWIPEKPLFDIPTELETLIRTWEKLKDETI